MAVDCRRAAIGNADIDRAAIAEALHQFAGGRIECHHHVPAHDDHAWRQVAFAGPVTHAASGKAGKGAGGNAFGLVHPDLLPGCSVERDDAGLGGDVHIAVHHHRHGGVECAQSIAPRFRELAHIAAVDILERGIAGGGEVTVDGAPVALGHGVLRDHAIACRTGQQECQAQAPSLGHSASPASSNRGESPIHPAKLVDYVLNCPSCFDNGLHSALAGFSRG